MIARTFPHDREGKSLFPTKGIGFQSLRVGGCCLVSRFVRALCSMSSPPSLPLCLHVFNLVSRPVSFFVVSHPIFRLFSHFVSHLLPLQFHYTSPALFLACFPLCLPLCFGFCPPLQLPLPVSSTVSHTMSPTLSPRLCPILSSTLSPPALSPSLSLTSSQASSSAVLLSLSRCLLLCLSLCFLGLYPALLLTLTFFVSNFVFHFVSQLGPSLSIGLSPALPLIVVNAHGPKTPCMIDICYSIAAQVKQALC